MAFSDARDGATREEILEKVLVRNSHEANQLVDREVSLMTQRLEAEEAAEAEIINDAEE